MPIYEYECIKCGKVMECMIMKDDKEPKKCSECGSKIKKILSKVSVHFRGKGFYQTENRKKEDKKNYK